MNPSCEDQLDSDHDFFAPHPANSWRHVRTLASMAARDGLWWIKNDQSATCRVIAHDLGGVVAMETIAWQTLSYEAACGICRLQCPDRSDTTSAHREHVQLLNGGIAASLAHYDERHEEALAVIRTV